MPRFALLEHDHPFLHWDFLLQTEEPDLLTWRLLESPLHAERCKSGQVLMVPARKLPNHREIYLDYEGEISGNRGRVIRRDAGLYLPLRKEAHILEMRLEGDVLQGFATLSRAQLSTVADAENTNWTFSWIRDCEN